VNEETIVHKQYNNDPKISLRVQDYIDRAISHERELTEEKRKFTDEKFLTIEEARRLAKIEQDRRLESMNEFREQLKDQASTFITREFFDSTVEAIRVEMQPALDAKTKNEGSKEERNWFIPSGPALLMVLFSLGAFVVSIISILIR
jgi:hypothetical protein